MRGLRKRKEREVKRLTPGLTAILFFAFLAGLFCANAPAEIYKYQDENGNWHFTDTPSEESAGEAQPVGGTNQSNSGLKNLRNTLYENYNPSTPVETAALATVTIECSMGTGAGFFITQNGHIITNRHVIRGDAEQLEKANQALDVIDARLKKIDEEFAAEKQRLKNFKQYLEEYQQTIDAMPDGTAKKYEKRRYAMERDRYEARQHDFQAKKSEYESRKAAYKGKKTEYRYTTSTAALTRNFKIILKDGTELFAYLLSTSNTHDLALLKVDGYKTPYIRPGASEALRQGDRVYAIGSPIGLRDSMSSGIFSGFENNFIKTDAKIYPGNSGGPLITRQGEVVGINSFKKLTRNFEGLGFAIPIDVATNEFKAHIKR